MTTVQAGAPKIPAGGSASAPGLAVVGDANSGILADVADQLAGVAGGVEQWRSGGGNGIDVKVGFKNSGAFENVAITAPAALASGGTTNDYAPTRAPYYALSSTGAGHTLNGLSISQVAGDLVEIYNNSAGGINIVIAHEAAGSTAANRFFTSTGANITLTPGMGRQFRYINSRWRPIG